MTDDIVQRLRADPWEIGIVSLTDLANMGREAADAIERRLGGNPAAEKPNEVSSIMRMLGL